jgi:pyridinium-3,5-biscarboxylic acid mononucleotide synthase
VRPRARLPSYTGTVRPDEVKELLTAVSERAVSTDQALAALRRVPIEDLGFAQLDTHRELRQGVPEAIYSEGKTPSQVVAIAKRLLESTTGPVLATRCPQENAQALLDSWPDAAYHQSAHLVVLRAEPRGLELGTVAIASAGTSDLPVAEEAAATAEALGARADRITDVGVAGVHRVLAVQDRLSGADVVIVVAGMDGALGALVAGITPAPVVAVPTSVGYGASFEGLAALLTMLNSCSPGTVVTNIDNGFGAAMFARRLLQTRR